MLPFRSSCRISSTPFSFPISSWPWSAAAIHFPFNSASALMFSFVLLSIVEKVSPSEDTIREDRFLEFLELKAKPRTTKGNSPARALRRDGAIPAVIYGPGKASVALSVNVYDLEQALKGAGGRQIFVDLAIEGDGFFQAGRA